MHIARSKEPFWAPYYSFVPVQKITLRKRAKHSMPKPQPNLVKLKRSVPWLDSALEVRPRRCLGKKINVGRNGEAQIANTPLQRPKIPQERCYLSLERVTKPFLINSWPRKTSCGYTESYVMLGEKVEI